jgi:putative transposase
MQLNALKLASSFPIFAATGHQNGHFFKRCLKYGVKEVSIMSRMKELEEENHRLKNFYLEEKLKA